jgi:hypothetical protein
MTAQSGNAVRELVGSLHTAVKSCVTLEDFLDQEAHFDEDSLRGRELLHLAADSEWVRGTRESVDLASSRTVKSTVQVQVDLAKITHEAFGDAERLLWLPLLILPPPLSSQTTLAPTPSVRDAGGTVVPTLPQAQARRWIAAALAEIIQQLMPGPANGDTAPEFTNGRAARTARERRLLLSAAIYRVLGDGGEVAPGSSERNTHQLADSRAEPARDDLLLQLQGFDALLRLGPTALPQQHSGHPHQLLLQRAVRVISAFTLSTTLVVIAMRAGKLPTEFSIQLPDRPLRRHHGGFLPFLRFLHGPNTRIELGVLLTSAETDRSVSVRLPEGVSYRERLRSPNRTEIPVAEVQVVEPLVWGRLDDLIQQIQQIQRTEHDAAQKCLVDLALTQLDQVEEIFRYHQTDEPASLDWLENARTQLKALLTSSKDSSEKALHGLEEAWATGKPQGGHLRRTVLTDVINPATRHVRMPAIDDPALRATPRAGCAKIQLDLGADEPAALYTARFSSFMNLAVLALVLLLLLSRSMFDPQVLGGVLTLFAAVQASRIEQPDRSSLRGFLAANGSVLAAASAMPTVLLGVGLAFSRGHENLVSVLTGVALAVQAGIVGAAVSWSWLSGRFGGGPRLRLSTEIGLDHSRIDVLHTSSWRTTVADALLLERPAFGYAIYQAPGELGELLDPTAEGARRTSSEVPVDMLALLRAGSEDHSLTFLAFRSEPESSWVEKTGARPVPLNTERLLAHEADIGHADFYVGVHRDEAGPETSSLASHPVLVVLKAARDSRRTVIDVQLPSIPPTGAAPDLMWTRVRVALRTRELAGLGTFLTEVEKALAAAEFGNLDLLVDVSAQSPPRRFGPKPGLGDEVGRRTLLPPSALNVGLSADASRWTVLEACANAHTGAEFHLLDELREDLGHLRLAGMSTALIHGVTVMFVLAEPFADNRPGWGELLRRHRPGAPQSPQRDRWNFPGLLDIHPFLQPPSHEAVSSSDTNGILIQVDITCADRPGLLALLFDRLEHEITRVVSTAHGALGKKLQDIKLSVWHARTDVAEGHLMVSRFVAKLSEDITEDMLPPDRLETVERALRSVLRTADPARAKTSDSGAGWLDAPAVVRLELVHGPDPDAG